MIGYAASMNQSKFQNILYISSVDVSQPNGPGVNEREFLIEFLNSTEFSGYALLPKPERALTELPADRCRFIAGKRGGPASLIKHQWQLYHAGMETVRELRIDLIVARLSVLPVGLARLLRRAGVPYVIKTLGGGVIDAIALRESMPALLAAGVARVNARLVKPIVTNALAVDVCTQELHERVIRMLGVAESRVACIENATNTDRFQPRDGAAARERIGLPATARVVGFVGGRPWERGAREMVDIAPRIIEQFPSAHFVVVGGGSGLPDLEEHARRLGVFDRFVFTGVIPYEEVPAYVNAFDVGVALDKPGRGELVGFSFQKVRQYVASGIPTVASDKSDLDLDTLKLGSVVPCGDLDAFERAVVRWLAMPAGQRTEFQQRARSFSQEHLSAKSALKRRLANWQAAIV